MRGFGFLFISFMCRSNIKLSSYCGGRDYVDFNSINSIVEDVLSLMRVLLRGIDERF